jgi:hypothetical protein
MFRTSCDAQVAHHAAWKRYAIAKNTVLSFRCDHQEESEKAANRHVHRNGNRCAISAATSLLCRNSRISAIQAADKVCG